MEFAVSQNREDPSSRLSPPARAVNTAAKKAGNDSVGRPRVYGFAEVGNAPSSLAVSFLHGEHTRWPPTKTPTSIAGLPSPEMVLRRSGAATMCEQTLQNAKASHCRTTRLSTTQVAHQKFSVVVTEMVCMLASPYRQQYHRRLPTVLCTAKRGFVMTVSLNCDLAYYHIGCDGRDDACSPDHIYATETSRIVNGRKSGYEPLLCLPGVFPVPFRLFNGHALS